MFSKIVASALLASADGMSLPRTFKDVSAPKIVYGAFGSSVPKYVDQLDAQLATWAAKPHSEGRFFFIGDEDFHKEPSEDFQAANCSASMNDVACKMGYLMSEALKRDADWVVVTQTDMYINTTNYEEQLATEDHTVPNSVGGSFGCGVGGFRAGCDEVTECGGYCGSSVYAISKPALKMMISDNDASFIAKMKGFTAEAIPEDMANSCALRQSGVPLHMFESQPNGCQFFQATGEMDTMKSYVMDNLCMMHMTTPKMLHWIQAIVTGDTATETDIAKEIGDEYHHCAECAREVEQTLLRNQHWDISGIPSDECAVAQN